MNAMSTSHGASGRGRDGFWARQSPKDKVAIGALVFSLVISVGLLLLGVLISDKDLSLGGRFALLTGNIVALIGTLQFAISRFFDDQKVQIDKMGTKLEDVDDRVHRALEEMERITVLGETYVKIFNQKEGAKLQYQSTLDAFLRRLSNCIDEKRSGALDIMDYYGALDSRATVLANDKDACQAEGTTFTGGIWAMSFLLDDAWDSSKIHEIKWLATLRLMDQSGIPTRRLWAFDKKMRVLLERDPIEEDGRELVRRLTLFCSDATAFANTQSFALPKEEILDEHVRLFGKGFFATEHSDGELSLIRGVCFDNLLSRNSLGGEIDFDEARIRQIRIQWQRYLALARPLKEFVTDIGSDSAKEYMKKTWSTVSAP